MLKNYLAIAVRSLLKNKVYSFINLASLSIGIAVSLLILLYVVHEFSYDSFHANNESIYRVTGKVNYGGQFIQMSAMSAQFGPQLKEKNEEVENYVRIYHIGRALIGSKEGQLHFENHVAFADTSFFSIFTFPLKQGLYSSLSKPKTVILTEAMAIKYFGTTDVLGNVLTYNKLYPLEVVGVMAAFPSNSTLRYDLIISFPTLGLIPEEQKQYLHPNASLGSYATYLQIPHPSAVSTVEASTRTFSAKSVDEKYFLEKFSGTHLGNNMGDSSTITYLYLFLTVGLIILVLALINYMNLTTARATLRAREVGIRKVIGARRSNLSIQFYTESALMTVLAFGLAVILVELALPVFLDTLHIQIDPTFLTSTWFMTVIASLLLFCILLSGSYPAFVLSRYMPVDVLKGKPGATGGGGWVRKGLIVFQFTASIALILITLGIHHQLNFLRNQKIGLHKEQVMVVTLDASAAVTYPSLKNELKNLTGVLQVAAASNPLYTTGQSALFTKTPRTKEDVFIYTMTIDENFFSTLDIQWANRPQSMAARGYVINEAALEDLKLSPEDVGMNLEMNETLPITGIVKNFNYTSLRDKIKGLVFTVASDTDRTFANNGISLYIRLDPAAKIFDKTAAIKSVFKKYQKEQPFEYYFLDEAFQQLYSSEDRLSTIFYAFTAIALFIASLGLFGLITFATEVRTKEISIRKVLGASIRTILVLLSKDFTLLVFIAVGLAIPFAGWYTQHWLTQFSYRVEIPWWYSILAALAAVVISVVITSVQGIKVALTNPAETLRSE